MDCKKVGGVILSLRKEKGFTQKELAEQTGVALRMIQQYEQGAKDIKKASAITVYALANRLHCSMEDLLE